MRKVGSRIAITLTLVAMTWTVSSHQVKRSIESDAPRIQRAAPADATTLATRQRFLEMFARAYFPGRTGQPLIVPREGDIITRADVAYMWTHGINKTLRKLQRVPQPPLSHAGAIPVSARAKRPALSKPSAAGQELIPRDRVEGLGTFGKPSGEFGTVQQTNDDDAVVNWDDEGRMRGHQPSLKKV